MRRLSDGFMNCLTSGFHAGLLSEVRGDHDLNLEIRDGYLNIYFKGNSLLKLTEVASSMYRIEIHQKFAEGLDLPSEVANAEATAAFVARIPQLKQRIIRHGSRSLEIEYEQMIIRANNFEPRNNSEYFIVDRQYAVGEGRFDLTGVFWNRNRRRKNQEVDLCLIEVKYALNQDIREVHDQLDRYYKVLKPIAAEIAEENETIFRQKLALGLYAQTSERLKAMNTLVISRDFSRFQFVLVFVDYNPNSAKLDLDRIASLPFANQIKVFRGGLAMWQQNVQSISSRD